MLKTDANGITVEQAQELVKAGMTEHNAHVVTAFIADLLAGDDEFEAMTASDAVRHAIENMRDLDALAS